MRCHACSAEVPESARYCPACAQPVGSVSRLPTGLATPSVAEAALRRGASDSPIGRLASWACAASSRAVPKVAQQMRRVELLMKGQSQERSWLTADGFVLPHSHEHWVEMVDRILTGPR